MSIQYTTLEKVINEKMNDSETVEGKLAYLVKVIAGLHRTVDKAIDVMPDDQREKLAINLGFKKM